MRPLYDLGDKPPLGEVPEQMHAFAVRQNRFGQPRDAWKREVLATPSIGPDEVLVYVMASGINFNNVWAALGQPLDVIAERQKMGEPEDFHAGGSDCSGIVWAAGKDVQNVKVGDEVIVHSGWWKPNDPWCWPARIRCSPRARASGAIRPTTAATASSRAPRRTSACRSPRASRGRKPDAFSSAARRRIACSWDGRRMSIEPGDAVLVWGGAGGLGSMALEITRAAGGRAVAVVSDEGKRDSA